MHKDLTNEELVILIQEGKDRQNNLEQLWLMNSGLINKAVRYYGNLDDPEDLRQEAFIALAKAAEIWDPDKGIKFSTYFYKIVLYSLYEYVNTQSRAVRVPRDQQTRILKYKRVINTFRKNFGRDPSATELLCLLNISRKQLDDLKKDIIALNTLSTSAPAGQETEDMTIEDVLPADNDPIGDLVDRIQAKELASVLWEIVEGLEDEQTEVIRSRFKNGRTLQECADDMGLTMEAARTIQEKALRKLREPKTMRKLRSYLSDEEAYRRGVKGTGLGTYKNSGLSSQELIMARIEELIGAPLGRQA